MKSRIEFSADEEYNSYLRKYFAGLAMQGLLAANDHCSPHNQPLESIANTSVKLADELLKQLER